MVEEKTEDNNGLTIDSFETISWLGKGAFGNVNLVRRKATNLLYALKVLNKEFIIQYDKVDSVFRERDILQDIQDHPNVVQFEATFQDDKHLYFLMEYVERGDLSELMRNKALPLDLAKFYTAELVNAL